MISFRLPDLARERLDEQADAAGVSRSEFARAAVLRTLDGEPHDLSSLPEELTDKELRRLLTSQALNGSVQAAKTLVELRRWAWPPEEDIDPLDRLDRGY